MKLRRDWLGRLLAIVILWLGIGLMLACFWFAYQMFQTPPQQLLNNPETNKPDLNSVVAGIWASLRSILLLVLMTIVGGMIANRGITLYLHVRKAEYEEMVSSKPPEIDK